MGRCSAFAAGMFFAAQTPGSPVYQKTATGTGLSEACAAA